MPKFLRFHCALRAFLESLTVGIGKAVAWLTAVMAVTVTAIVIGRAFFDAGAIALQESVTYMHALVIMLASAYTLRDNGHVRVDIFYRRFSPVNRAWVDALGAVLLLLPLAIFIVVISWDYVAASWRVRETSADAGGLAAVFLLKSLIILNGVLLALQALAEISRNLITLTFADD